MVRVALMVDTRSLGSAVKRQTRGIMRVDYGALLRLAEDGVRQALHVGKMAWQEKRSLVFVAAYLGPSENTRQNGLVAGLAWPVSPGWGIR